MYRKHLALLCLCALLAVGTLFSQNLYRVPLEQKVQNSTVIIEGHVVSQSSYWNDAHTTIVTSNLIEVYKIFKGFAPDTINIITVGGTVDNESMHGSDMLELAVGETGMFFCQPAHSSVRSAKAKKEELSVFSGIQGFIRYGRDLREAGAPLSRYKSIKNELYPELLKLTGQPLRNIRPSFKVNDAQLRTDNTLSISMTSFSPATVHAGALLDPTNNILTINGSGFGVAGGTVAGVEFQDADGGTLPVIVLSTDNLIISWTNTKIRIKVPTRAGTGTFTVRNSANEPATSATELIVDYAILTSNFSGITKEINLMNTNGSGGYTLLYSTNTAGSGKNFDTAPEKATFQRALKTWKDLVGVNFIEGGTTPVSLVTMDGNNVVMFDNTATGRPPLDIGTLAICFSNFRGCNPVTTNEAVLVDFDIVVRNPGVSAGSVNLTVGPCPPAASSYGEYDLEQVLLHELGHAITLGHIIDDFENTGYVNQVNPGKLMHFAEINGNKRNSPDRSAYTGALYAVNPQGNTYGACTPNTEMTVLSGSIIHEGKDECPTFPVTAFANNTSVAFDLEHSTSNTLTDPQFTAINMAGTGTGVTNTAFYALKTGNTSSSLFLTVTGYATSAPGQASCAISSGGNLTTGVELSLYQVNACPLGQAFPAPIAYRTFSASGPLATVTGLAANTTYLMVFDGIENTKASFSLAFSGSVMPIKLTDFSGKVMEGFNEIHWKASYAADIRNLHIQKSGDGVHFQNMWTQSTGSMLDGKVPDHSPYAETYYRLVVENVNGSKETSEVIVLKRADLARVMLGPNPAKAAFTIQFSQPPAATYSVRIYNHAGQLVASKENIADQTTSIPVSQLAAGLYQVIISQKNGKTDSYKVVKE